MPPCEHPLEKSLFLWVKNIDLNVREMLTALKLPILEQTMYITHASTGQNEKKSTTCSCAPICMFIRIFLSQSDTDYSTQSCLCIYIDFKFR